MTNIIQEWKAEVPSAFAHGPSIIFGVWDIWLAVLPLYEIFSWLISKKSPVNCTTLFQTANWQKLTTSDQDKRNGHGLHTYKTCQTATCWLLTTVPDTNRSSSFCQGDTRHNIEHKEKVALISIRRMLYCNSLLGMHNNVIPKHGELTNPASHLKTADAGRDTYKIPQAQTHYLWRSHRSFSPSRQKRPPLLWHLQQRQKQEKQEIKRLKTSWWSRMRCNSWERP